jgi:Cu/Ag efflux pump CusA
MALLAIAAAIAAVLLAQAALGSWLLALLCCAAVLASLSGGVVGATVAGRDASLGALVGLLGVAGLAARWSLVLLARLRAIEAARPHAERGAVVLRAARERLVPTLAAAAGIVALLLPLAPMDGASGTELLRPVAIAVIGGVATAALMTVFLLPVAYAALRPGPPVESTDLTVDDMVHARPMEASR